MLREIYFLWGDYEVVVVFTEEATLMLDTLLLFIGETDAVVLPSS